MPPRVKKDPVDRSTLPLSSLARHVVVPEGMVDSLWDEVADRCWDFGIEFDTWQDNLGMLILGLDDCEMFTATVGGIVLSIPRQVAKTFLISRIVIALCTLYPNLKVIWTAHHGSTTENTFDGIRAFCERPEMGEWVSKDDISSGNGDLEIKFLNGSWIKFGARGHGFGRGFPEIDIMVFDEAQILTSAAVSDMVPTANQYKLKYGSLIFYMGTPPRPKDPGEEFTAKRRKALKDKPNGNVVVTKGSSLYVELSADENVGRPDGPTLEDETQILKANPSVPHRTPWDSVWRMRENISDDEDFRREALGVWDSEGVKSWQVFNRISWQKCEVKHEPVDGAINDGAIAYGVQFSPDGQRVALAAARKNQDQTVFTEVIGVWPTEEGTAHLVQWLKERWGTNRMIAIDGKGAAGDLIASLHREGVPKRRVQEVSAAEKATYCSGLLRAVRESTLQHSGQSALYQAARNTDYKFQPSGAFYWKAADPTTQDITAIGAATVAHGVATMMRNPTGRKKVYGF